MADAEGRFEIEGYPPGRYQVQVSFTGAPNKGYYSDPLVFEIADEDVTELELKATRGANISGSVVVEGSSDPSLLGGVSALMAEQVQQAGAGGRLVFVTSMVGPGGRFEFGGVRPGRTRINPVGLPEGFHLTRVERAGVPVTDGMDISAGERVSGVRVVLAYGTGSIRGQIKLGGGNIPTKFGWWLDIRLAGGEHVRSEMLDAAGLFWVKGLAPGSYEVTATLDYAEMPGVTPATHPAPVRQVITVENGVESRAALVLDLSRAGKNN